MSADEIRRLAEEKIFVEVADKRDIGEGGVCDYSYEKKSEINSALLAYAAMVERCEEVCKKYEKMPCKECASGDVEPDCPYYGEPGGCSSPTYQKFSSSFVCDINYIRGES